MSGQQAGPPSLPTTIEGATQRYLANYEKNFQGPVSERYRLKDYAEAKIHALRKKAPTFFEEKLPQIVNQAASSLLNYDTTTEAGCKAFNGCHADFLRVLDELKKSQPAGDISFQSERNRAILKEDLRKQHLKIRDRIADLEAQELDVEELGGDGDTDGTDLNAEELAVRREAAARREESRYQKIFVELDDLKNKLKQVATKIAMMEGEILNDEIEFKLKVAPRTMLERLDKSQLKKLEEQIAAFLAKKKSRREFPQKNIVEGWLTQAGVIATTFKQQEFNDLTKDTSEAIRTFFRERENERRNEYFDSLINNKKLLPKEGIILSSPDDIPDDVREQLEVSERSSKRKLDEYCEQYSKMPCEEDAGCDDLDADQSNDEMDNEFERELAIFKRVKEEPRDDCEPDDEGDEVLVSEDVARGIRETLNPDQQEVIPEQVEEEEEEEEEEEDEEEDEEDDQDDDDDELECLGVVEPQDKCPTIDLTEK